MHAEGLNRKCDIDVIVASRLIFFLFAPLMNISLDRKSSYLKGDTELTRYSLNLNIVYIKYGLSFKSLFQDIEALT